jgi:c-di-AMP phosphodiesterase-like protein
MNSSDLATPLALTYTTMGFLGNILTDGKNIEWLGPLIALVLFKLYEKYQERQKEQKKLLEEEQRLVREEQEKKEELHVKQEEFKEMVEWVREIINSTDETKKQKISEEAEKKK